MPSTNKLASFKQGQRCISCLRANSSSSAKNYSRCTLGSKSSPDAKLCITKSSFRGLASFGAFTMVVGIFSVIFLLFVSLFAVGGNSAYAANGPSSNTNQVNARILGTIAIRLLDSTATTEISSLNFNLTPTPNGVVDTETTVVDVATTNPTGYKLYMQSDYQTKDSSGNPTGTYTTNLNNTDTDVADNIPTAIPTSGLPKVFWNYASYSHGSTPSTTSVIPAHGSPDKIAQNFSATNSDQIDVPITVGVDTSIVSGTYENSLLFSAIANPENATYNLNFNPDGGTMTGTDISESAAAGVHTMTIPNSSDYVPTKTGYVFEYWQIQDTSYAKCNVTGGDSSTGSANCAPGDTLTIYFDGESFEDFEVDVALKAIYRLSFGGITTMQQMTPTICNNAVTTESAILTDTRDNNTYTVKKLLDGHCWMTQNLRLNGPKSASELNSSNTNVLPNSTFALSASDSSAWCGNYSLACVNKSMTLDSGNPVYGTYYNWYAATASSGTYELASGNATSSICPKGWRLPTGGLGGEFDMLYGYYNTFESLAEGDPNYVLSGYRYGSTTAEQGSWGQFWASTAYDNQYAHRLALVEPDEVITLSRTNKILGASVRCVAE